MQDSRFHRYDALSVEHLSHGQTWESSESKAPKHVVSVRGEDRSLVPRELLQQLDGELRPGKHIELIA